MFMLLILWSCFYAGAGSESQRGVAVGSSSPCVEEFQAECQTEGGLSAALLQDSAGGACSGGECLASQLLQKVSEARRKGADSVTHRSFDSELTGNHSVPRLIALDVSVKPTSPRVHKDAQETPMEQMSISSDLMGQARGLLALVQASASTGATKLQSSASSSAILLLLCIIVVAVGLYLMSLAWSLASQKGHRRAPMSNVSAANTRGSLPPRPAESLLSGWPSMANPTPSSKQVPRQSLRPSPARASVPVICENLVMPTTVTRLAVPVLPLLDRQEGFNFDVLALSGEPLLCASTSTLMNRRSISISAYHAGTLLATVSPGPKGLDLYKADGTTIGTLSKQSPGRSMNPLSTSSDQYALLNAAGQVALVILLGQKMPHELKMLVMQEDGSPLVSQKAVVTRKEATTNLPGEHFEIIVNCDVDAVLILSIFLGLTVFALPPVPADVLQKSSATLPVGSSPISFSATPRPQSVGNTSRPSMSGPYASYY